MGIDIIIIRFCSNTIIITTITNANIIITITITIINNTATNSPNTINIIAIVIVIVIVKFYSNTIIITTITNANIIIRITITIINSTTANSSNTINIINIVKSLDMKQEKKKASIFQTIKIAIGNCICFLIYISQNPCNYILNYLLVI